LRDQLEEHLAGNLSGKHGLDRVTSPVQNGGCKGKNVTDRSVLKPKWLNLARLQINDFSP